jgi:molybdate transport system substrate-binding protein
MDDLAGAEYVDGNTRKNFAGNTLVVIVPPGSNLISLPGLADEKVKKVAVGNPKTVPAGQYTEQAFNNLHLIPDIQSKLVYAEDVRQVLDYVIRGEVDAGFVYASDASSAGSKVKVGTAVPENLYSPIQYPIAVIRESRQKQAAQQFIDLVLSADGQSILAKHGFRAISVSK